MRRTVKEKYDELTLRVERSASDVLYELIRAIIKESYGEPLLALIISRLLAENKIREPKELIEYMIRNPEEFYDNILLHFKDIDSANAFLKTIFDELSRRLRVSPMGSEIVKHLHDRDYSAFREKLLEILYYIKTRTTRPMF